MSAQHCKYIKCHYIDCFKWLILRYMSCTSVKMLWKAITQILLMSGSQQGGSREGSVTHSDTTGRGRVGRHRVCPDHHKWQQPPVQHPSLPLKSSPPYLEPATPPSNPIRWEIYMHNKKLLSWHSSYKKNSYICINFPSWVLIEERIWRHGGNKILLHLFKGHVSSLEITLVPH